MLKQTEEDADKEILELKTKYEKLLRSEREANVRYRTLKIYILQFFENYGINKFLPNVLE